MYQRARETHARRAMGQENPCDDLPDDSRLTHLAEDPPHDTGGKEDNKDLEEEHPNGGVYMVRDAGAEVSEGRGERRSSFCGTQCRRGKCLTPTGASPKGQPQRSSQYHDVEDIGKDSPLFRHAVPLCCKRR